MKVSVERLSPVRRKVHVEVPQEVVRRELDQAYRQLSRTVRIKGFRPGKVPLAILKRRYGSQVQDETSLQLVKDTVAEAFKQGEVEAVSDPELGREPLLEGEPFRYSVVVEVKPDIAVRDYGKIPVRRKQVQVTDSEVEAQLALRREASGFLRTLGEDRVIRRGDYALLDFKSFTGTRPVPGGEVKGYQLEVGAERFNPEFEEKLLGATKGEQRSIEVPFAADHHNKNLAGKRVRFEVVVKDVMERQVPELNDEFARTTGTVQTLEELRRLIRQQLEKQKAKAVDAEVRQQLVDEVIARNPFEVPNGIVERELQRMLETIRYRLAAQHVTLEQAGIREETFAQQNRDRAEKSARANLILERLAVDQGLTVTDEELDEGLRRSAEDLNRPLEQVKDFYAKNNLIEPFRSQLLEEKVLRLLLDQALVTEVPPGSPDETKENKETP
jgi:trigger factor